MCSPVCFIFLLRALKKVQAYELQELAWTRLLHLRLLVTYALQYTLQANIFQDVSSIQFSITNYISFGFLAMNSFQSLEFIP